VAALAYIGAERVAPGRTRHFAGNLLVVPEDVAGLVSQAVTAGGLDVRGTDDVLSAQWRKLFGNLVANPITALTERRLDVMHGPGMVDLARGLLDEALTVARAEGASLGPDDVESTVAGVTRYSERTGSSMLYDRMAGRPLEHQFLTGEVVRRAATHGIAVPLNAAILALLSGLDEGLRAAG
jgi:2-dehydropantoate 2-reductase